MARIRSIKPQFCTSLSIARLSKLCRLHFVMLWTYADDEGRGVDNPLLIKAAIWPLDEDVSTDQISAWQEELEQKGRLVRYGAEDGGRYFSIVGFTAHQKPQKPHLSSYPEPPDIATVGLPYSYDSQPIGLPSVVVVGEVVGAGEKAVAVAEPYRRGRKPQVPRALLSDTVELLLLRLGKVDQAATRPDPAAWLEGARRGLARDYQQRLSDLLAANPWLTAEKAADLLVPPTPVPQRPAEYVPEGVGNGVRPDMGALRAAAKARQGEPEPEP